MAVKYVDSNATGAASGDNWTDAYVALATGLTNAGAGGTVYVSNNHAETGASALASPGTATSPTRVICADDTSGAPPSTVATTGTLAATTYYSPSGFCYVYGLTFTSSANGNVVLFTNGSGWGWIMEECQWTFTSGGNNYFFIGSSSGPDNCFLQFVNTDVSFAATSAYFMPRTNFYWKGGAVLNVGPNVLFSAASGVASRSLLDGVDLTLIGTTKSLSTQSGSNSDLITFRNCKLGASVAPTTGTHLGLGGTVTELYNCSSGDTHYERFRETFGGTEQDETTYIRTTNPASNGTTAISWKIVTSGTPTVDFPYVSTEIAKWNDTLSEITVTVDFTHDNATDLDNDEIWLEVQYQGTASSPLSIFKSDRIADPLTTPAAQTTSGSAWNGSLTNDNPQELSVTFTPAEIGFILARVMVAKQSYTVYVNPVLDIS